MMAAELFEEEEEVVAGVVVDVVVEIGTVVVEGRRVEVVAVTLNKDVVEFPSVKIVVAKVVDVNNVVVEVVVVGVVVVKGPLIFASAQFESHAH
jgi:hypothetical protein